MQRSHYRQLAALFVYPTESWAAEIREVGRALGDGYPEAASRIMNLADLAAPLDRHDLEEVFTRSFDVQSLTTLDIGYVLFGDDYKRGDLLANLTREHEAAGTDCGTELPDHLPNVLRWLAVAEDEELVSEFVVEILYPALRHMIGEFDPERMHRRDELYRKHYRTLIDVPVHATLYSEALRALRSVVESDFDVESTLPTLESNDFLRVLDTELTVESATSP